MAEALASLPKNSENALTSAECLTRYSEFGYMTNEGETTIREAAAALALLDTAPSGPNRRESERRGRWRTATTWMARMRRRTRLMQM